MCINDCKENFKFKEGTISNVEVACNYIRNQSGETDDNETILKTVASQDNVHYLNERGDSVEVGNGDMYKLICTGYTDCRTSKYLYISLRNINGEYIGFFVGTAIGLKNGIVSRIKVRESSDLVEDKDYETLELLYSYLLIKESWKDNAGGLDRIKSYIYAIFNRCIRCNDDTVLKENSAGNMYCFNSKLLNKFNDFIYIACEKGIYGNGTYKPFNIKIIVSKSDFSNAGFTGKFPEPVSFFTKVNDIVFDADLDDFDLADISSLNHLVDEDRKKRLPEEYRDISDTDLAMSIRYSVEMALKMTITDYKFIAPMYSVKHDKIQFLVPLFIRKQYSEEPGAVLIISKQENSCWYKVFTMLDIESAYVDARVISRTTTSWLDTAISKLDSQSK